MKISHILLIGLLSFLSMPVQAAQGGQPWYMLLLVVVVISTIASSALVWRNKKYQTMTEKAMLFGAWFWFLIFIQVMLYGFYIGFGKYFN